MEAIVQQFMDRYLSREEIAYRLPVSMPISQFWPVMEEARKKAAIFLPLQGVKQWLQSPFGGRGIPSADGAYYSSG